MKDLSAVRSWAEQSLFLLRKLLPLATPIAGYEGWVDDEFNTLGNVLTACARSSESVLLLVAFGQFWDAEMLIRSVAEGTLKFCYLVQDANAFKERYREYSHDLFEIALYKDHAKAEEVLAGVPDPDSRAWKPIRDRLLPDEELNRIRTLYPREVRRQTEGKWGFARLITALSQPGAGQVHSVGVLAHGYAIASHVQHVDYIGAVLPFDHNSRPAERAETIQAAHALRLITDAFSFFLIRMISGYRFVGHELQPIWDAQDEIAVLKRAFGDVYEAWLRAEFKDGPP